MTLQDAITVLADAGVASPEHDARALARYAEQTGADFAALIQRRAERAPLQHLIGSVGFRFIELAIGPGVFVPRPETEVVVGRAVQLIRQAGPAPVVVDLCSGSGTVALSIANEVPSAQVHAVEVDPDAVQWLQRNALAREQAGDAPIQVHLASARDALPELDGRVDVVVSNPPYVADHEFDDVDPEVRDHDPHVALSGGEDGLAVIDGVVTAARRLLRPDGHLVVEHSDRQGESVPALMRSHGFVEVADHLDLTERPRYATGRWPG